MLTLRPDILTYHIRIRLVHLSAGGMRSMVKTLRECILAAQAQVGRALTVLGEDLLMFWCDFAPH